MPTFPIITERAACYEVPGFAPLSLDRDTLVRAGIDYPISDEIDAQLIAGSEWFRQLYDNRSLTPPYRYEEALADPDEELEIHNYTGICPTNVLEVSPSVGSCAVACQYCLVTDGKHVKPIQVFTNYAEKLANSLERNVDRELFYYFSPKTEAFSEPHLWNGLAHNVLRTFIAHYAQHPDSRIRIFIATKAGPQHLGVAHEGETLFDLLAQVADKTQVNGSIGIMPPYLRDILEPNAASIAERLEALVECRARGIWAESVLCQPLLLPYLTPETIDDYCAQLAASGVRNIKPEFLTTEVRNLVLLTQFVHHYDPERLGEFFYPYLAADNQAHIKQRSRLAPDKQVCVEKLALIRDAAVRHGITISICNWVKRELSMEASWVGEIDCGSSAHGYRCLGYQTNLFAG